MWNREVSPKDDTPRPTPPVAVAVPVAPPAPAPVPTPVPVRAVEPERRAVAWVGKSVLFRGDLISLEDMTIDGRVEGTIELRDHNLTVGPDAHFQADIIAKTVTIHGKVTGTIVASETVSLSQTGSVEGDITSSRLAMADGAVL